MPFKPNEPVYQINKINQFTIVPNYPNILNKTNEPVYHLNQQKNSVPFKQNKPVYQINKINQFTILPNEPNNPNKSNEPNKTQINLLNKINQLTSYNMILILSRFLLFLK